VGCSYQTPSHAFPKGCQYKSRAKGSMFYTKVGVWVIANLVGKAVDESNVDYIDGGIRAGPGERALVSSLSPVHNHIGTG
jgi:hypothetical protein